MERITLFTDVLLPLPLKAFFTYRVPFELNDKVEVGKRVVVQFGRKKIYTALIRKIHTRPPEKGIPKYILSVLDTSPIVNETQFTFWEWISQYYMCTVGEVMNVALPLGLKLVSESKVILTHDFNPDDHVLNENEYLVAEALLNRQELSITDIMELTGLQKTIPLIKTMIDKRIILVKEELYEQFRPKKETFVCLSDSLTDNEEKLREIFDELGKRAFKQLQIVMALLSQTQKSDIKEIKRSELLKIAEASYPQLAALEKKGILKTYEKVTSRLKTKDATHESDTIEFSEAQQETFDTIVSGFKEKEVSLLHGITSSGKTEIYIKLIEAVIAEGKQVLYLLPEIALTTQIIHRLQKYFGDKIGVYHSRYNKNEKVEIWNKVISEDKDKQYRIILGPRSALFLPYQKLGLIIVDEEHDNSYKQFDPAPRYSARDSAIYLASLHKAKTLLGSATPSVESYYNASHGKYQLVELMERYGGIPLPEILVADIKEESRRKSMKSHFSSFLLKHIEEALENKEQVILFQNRRGFSLRLECEKCHWIPECHQCDVSLTYHKKSDHLRCHYCGSSTKVPSICPVCSSPQILMRGFGTEKIEEDLSLIFPDAGIERMDLDTTRSKNAFQRIITDFEDRKIDILVGTQMVTKGLDFDNVSIVGILNADNMLSYPDFRSPERSFQLMSQVSGRSGRKNKRGKVIIQTYNPWHSVIRDVIDNNYKKSYTDIILERRNFKYPPFYRLIEIKLKHKNYDKLNGASNELANALRIKFGKRILGPEYPIVSRIKNLFIKHILVKIERDKQQSQNKLMIAEIIEDFQKERDFKSVQISIDVDPQ